MRRHRNVKIVATLGPASEDYDTIRALHEAGVFPAEELLLVDLWLESLDVAHG